MASLAFRISRAHLIVKRSNFSSFMPNAAGQAIGIWTAFNKLSPVNFFKCSSLPFSIPVRWSHCCAVPFMGRMYSSTDSTSKVLLPEQRSPSINQNLIQTDPIPHTDSTDGRTMFEEIDDVLPLSPLEEISDDEALQIAAEPLLPPSSFTLRDYVDRSETLSKLVLLGVDLSKLERRPHVATFLLKLDFEKDVQNVLLFLKDVGVEDAQLGSFITINPFILTVEIEILKKRVAYLVSQKFNKEDIARMVSRAPYLLNFSVDRLDNRLFFFQKELGINPQKVCKIEMGFRENEIQHMITCVPKILTGNKRRLTEIFDYVHNKMDVPHQCIVKFPQVFNTRLLKVKERHMFLTFLGRAQYDPAQPNYVSLDKFISVPDEVFCVDIAKASVQDFQTFLKTL
ncbi:transcription termination factor 3, mitochondrial isoform X1 [Ambystoma mexicanum]|uniref:transcription termination factor 3, mitochondrial isoform X1 n=1 Tax=Ambystoma mexicanum TaxID=8296 RepID=UPI0037E75D0C